MSRRRWPAALAACWLLASAATASTPERIVDRTRDSFEAGTPEGVSIGGDGELRVAPSVEELGDVEAARIWAVAIDGAGRLVVAQGGPGAVHRFDSSGADEVLLRTDEGDVQAIAVDGEAVYAATSPEGRVLRLTGEGDPVTWLDPPDRYIWDLALDGDGTLFVATGEPARVYRVGPDGRSTIVLESPEAHVRSLAVDGSGRVLAGTEGNGYVYRLAPAADPEVLFSPPEGEITALSVAPDGTVHVAALGLAQEPRSRREVAAGVTRVTVTAAAPSEEPPVASAEPAAVTAPAPSSPTVRLASSVYEVRQEGASRRIFASEVDRVHALAWSPAGVVAGTGDRGVLLLLGGEPGAETRLARAQADHVTSLTADSAGAVSAGTSNPAKLLRLSAGAGRSGTYLSGVKDAGALADWGRISWEATVPRGTGMALALRTGNTAAPDGTWSSWWTVPPDPAGHDASVPAGRYLQYRVDLQASPRGESPVVHGVELSYLQRNLAPEIEKLELLAPGVILVPVPTQNPDQEAVARAEAEAGFAANGPRTSPPPRKSFREGMRTLRWEAEDPNGDELRYDVEYRPEPEGPWRHLARDLGDAFVAVDTRQLPDGSYRLRVTARDDPSNPPERALAGQRTTDPVDVDNTAPTILDLETELDGGALWVGFRVVDSFTGVSRVEVSIDAGSWRVVLPLDGIPDGREERFRVHVGDSPGSAVTFAVKARDRFGNEGAARLPLR